MNEIVFFVPGVPSPGGSKRAFLHSKTRRIVVVDDAKRVKPWRDRIVGFAMAAYSGPPLLGPLRLEMTFTFARPRFHFGTGRNAEKLRASAPPRPDVKPDATKLVRAAEDALTGVLWRDDSQVVDQVARKIYGPTPGLEIRVSAAVCEGD